MGNPLQWVIGGTGGEPVVQLGKMSNRHGLIAGATGTGKTVTLQILAEGFSRMGVPVFASDIKGDLSGLAASGQQNATIDKRLKKMTLSSYAPRSSPVIFWDIHGEKGHPVRTTISEMGPLLISNLLELNDTQSGVLYAAFKIADDEGLLILDLKDLVAMLRWVGENANELRSRYGHITAASIGAIQRRLLVLEEQGGAAFFGEPAVKLQDLMQSDFSGHGVISILDASRLHARSPRVYTTFLLWLLSELYEQLPETGDEEKPRMVFFFDEAHLLFEQAPKVLLEKIEQVVRLIRSKGVGIYFVTQSPSDIPDEVLGQLGLRIQHALRAFTPKDQRDIRQVADTFRANPDVDIASEITELEIGEALVSCLDEKGSPSPVKRVLIRPPESRIGPLTDSEREEHLRRSPLAGRYEAMLDRQSAYEILRDRALIRQEEQEAARSRQPAEKKSAKLRPGRQRQGLGEAMARSAARSIGSQIGRQIVRGILGSLFGGRR